jgi:hypothetical protein
MKTIKLFRLKKQNGLAINEFDLSNYKSIKFPTKESMILEIAKKLKKPVSEIQKKKTLINAAYKQRFDSFIEKKIVDTLAYSISDMLFSGNKPESRFNPFRGWQENKRYVEKTKTFEVELSYKNRIEFETAGVYHKNRKDILEKLPKFVRHWTTPEGKKEIELIEKTLESLGKIKFEIYDTKGKKIETLYAKYKKTTEPLIFQEEVKEIISKHNYDGFIKENYQVRGKWGNVISSGMSVSFKK